MVVQLYTAISNCSAQVDVREYPRRSSPTRQTYTMFAKPAMPKMPMRRPKIAMPRGLSSLILSLCKSIYSNFMLKDVLGVVVKVLLFTLNSVIEHSFHSKSSPMPSPSLLALREIPRRTTASATCLEWRARSQNSPILYQLPFLIISWSICHQRYRRLLGDYRDSGKNCSRFGEQRLCLRSKHSPAEKGGSLWNLWKAAAVVIAVVLMA